VSTVILDPVEHRYWLENEEGTRREVPGVSHILQSTGNHGGSFKPPARYYEKGRRIHELCEALDRGMTIPSVDSDLALSTYVQAWMAFKRENQVRILGIEEIVFEPDLFYAGTLDRTIVMRGRDKPIVVDLKSGAKADWHTIQLAAYLLAHAREKWRDYDAAAVYLKPSGRYGWSPVTESVMDWTVERWRGIVQQYKEAAA